MFGRLNQNAVANDGILHFAEEYRMVAAVKRFCQFTFERGDRSRKIWDPVLSDNVFCVKKFVIVNRRKML